MREAGNSDLFSWLGDDPEAKYEAIRRRLLMVFQCGRFHDPEDMVQEVFLRAQKSISRGNEIYAHDPMFFFLAIARNLRSERRRSPWREQGISHELQLTRQGDGHASRIEQQIYTRELMEQATPLERRVFSASLESEPSEAAAQLGIRPNTFRVVLHRARKRMRGLLGDSGPPGIQ